MGQKNGAKKQYRYGNLHIREYDDKYLVHMDKVDPRQDPLGHLVHDAPEILIGVASGIIAGKKVASSVYKLQKNMTSCKRCIYLCRTCGICNSRLCKLLSSKKTKRVLRRGIQFQNLSTIQTFIKLVPLVFALKKDRREWVRKQGKNVDLKRYQKNARKALRHFISLGPVYIKLGQWLSSRADILPQPYLEELAKLQDEVPAESFDKVKPIIEKDLGPMDQNFDFVDTNVISGASLRSGLQGKVERQRCYN